MDETGGTLRISKSAFLMLQIFEISLNSDIVLWGGATPLFPTFSRYYEDKNNRGRRRVGGVAAREKRPGKDCRPFLLLTLFDARLRNALAKKSGGKPVEGKK